MTSAEQHNSDHMQEKTYRNNNIVPPHWREEMVIANGIRPQAHLIGLKKNSFLFLRLRRSSIWMYSSMSRLFQRALPGKKRFSGLHVPSCS